MRTVEAPDERPIGFAADRESFDRTTRRGVEDLPLDVERLGEGEGGEAVFPTMIPMTLSVDHRAIDGAYSAAFLRRLKEIIETREWAAAVP